MVSCISKSATRKKLNAERSKNFETTTAAATAAGGGGRDGEEGDGDDGDDGDGDNNNSNKNKNKKKQKTKDSTGGSGGGPKNRNRRRPPPPSGNRKVSTNVVTGLSIPFRTIKKAMKLDPDILIVQNEAALVVTKAAEMFLENLALESLKISKNHVNGRNTIRYEDVAEARSNDPSLSFLNTILP
mmetsp:Transcript_11682/g.27988  ORF Transcript_11682/g.27988 Transcript_11682/m.27988 type:complete len:185 (-) Transcript_11682:232-786(-)